MVASRKFPESHLSDNILIYKSRRYCMDADGNDVLIKEEETGTETETEHSHSDSDEHSEDHEHEESSSSAKQNCHFHAGVE